MLPTAPVWFDRTSIDDALTLITEPHVAPMLRANVWHIRGSERDLLVDAGLGLANLREAFPDLFDQPIVVVATHGHVDHTGGMGAFDEWAMHGAEETGADGGFNILLRDTYPEIAVRYLTGAGYDVPPVLLDALPHAGYDPSTFRPYAGQPTAHLAEGDVIALGPERSLTVLHFPGHTPGGVGLFDEVRGILFSGDTVYDGPLLDRFPESSIPDYRRSMERLRDLPIEIVHAGHDPSFAPARLHELVDQYLASRTA